MQQEKKHNTFLSLLGQVCLSVSFGLFIYILVDLMDQLEGPGGIFSASAVFVGIPLTVLGGLLFYVLTTFHSFLWTVINIALNIYLIRIEIDFANSIRSLEGLPSVLFITCIWAINKMVIAKFLDNFNPKRKPSNRLDSLIYRAWNANNTHK